jgi:hypothetical protein
VGHYEDLKAIENADPDGREHEPTDEAHYAHEQWARTTYGDATWQQYKTGGWGREPGYHTEGHDHDDNNR